MSADQGSVDIPPEIIDYLNEQQTLTLATASPGGVPRASTFLYVNDGPTLYFWSRAGTATARQIDQNPVVSFTIDDFSEDLNQTRGAQGSGECAVVLSGAQIARVADMFGRKFPSLSPGSTMAISFFRITPTELQFTDNASAASSDPERGPSATMDGTFGAVFHRDRSYSVVSDLPTQPPDNVIASLQIIEAKAGDTIVRRGGPADKFFIVVDGEVEVVGDGDGVISTLGPGSLFGDMAIMLDQPRSASIRAASDAKLVALGRDTFRDLIAQSTGMTAEFDQVVRARLDALASA
jgi:uncharacterized protein YhbP (UPF0306 family)